jgi:hypothetical protein
MTYYRKRPILISAALLFAGAGCPGPNEAPPPSLDAGAQVRDAGQTADGGTPGRDTGVLVPSDAGVVPPADAGVEPPADAGPQPPAPGEPCAPEQSAACDLATTLPDLVCNHGIWTAVESGWTDTDLLCGLCSDLDPHGVGTSECAPVELGGPCFYADAAVCDAQGIATLICQGGVWAEGYEWCAPCEEDLRGVQVSYCAVPGFIGIDRAGRPRKPARHLRQRH